MRFEAESEQNHEHINSLKDTILVREEQISELTSKVQEADWRLAESVKETSAIATAKEKGEIILKARIMRLEEQLQVATQSQQQPQGKMKKRGGGKNKGASHGVSNDHH